MNRCLRRAFVAALLLPVLGTPVSGQAVETEYEGAAALGLALRQLSTTKRVLMIAAHPDDEQTQLLSALALGQGASVAYLSLTRGEGGQNGIGPELQEALGLLRTEELLAARRLDGTHQYFTRAIDWGFSKNVDEAFRMWPREDLLRDVVAVVRHFRPDIVVSVFTGTARDGHGQHQAAGIMAAEAFTSAADPLRFPEQLATGLPPHAPTHLYRLIRGPEEIPSVQVATGELDPLLGKSHFQIAMASRSRHRSQDMGRLQTPGPQTTALHLASTRRIRAGEGLFAGVDTTLLQRLGGAGGSESTGLVGEILARYELLVRQIRESFNPLHGERIVGPLAEAARLLRQATDLAAPGSPLVDELRFHLAEEQSKIDGTLVRAANVTVDAIGSDETPVPGQTFALDLMVWNGGVDPIELTSLEPRLPVGWSYVARQQLRDRIEPGSVARARFDVAVPATEEPTEPYFLRLRREEAMYRWPSGTGPVGVPFQEEEIGGIATLRIAGASVTAESRATYQGVDPRSGEFRRPLRVVPAVSLTVDPQLAVLPIAWRDEPLAVSVRLAAEEPDGISGVLRISVPPGWRAEPSEVPIRFGAAGEERIVDFRVYPSSSPGPGRQEVAAVFIDERGRDFDRGYTLIDYAHIHPRPLFRPARVDVEVVDVEVPSGLRVGYIAAAGDNVPSALGQLGLRIEMLGPAQVAAAPLDPYDIIVVGIRAYEGRPDLVTHNQRLLDYVSRGGTVIVQYNQYEYTEPGIAPYPIAMARPHDRVTDAEADVRLLDPTHTILTTPNRITAADFEGWVQERGLYFLNAWDARYVPLLEMADPGEPATRGGLLVARYGEGTYVYTGLALFRQLPAGVPGAYRLFANLLALGAE